MALQQWVKGQERWALQQWVKGLERWAQQQQWEKAQ
jgi:hypothetical protein